MRAGRERIGGELKSASGANHMEKARALTSLATKAFIQSLAFDEEGSRIFIGLREKAAMLELRNSN